MTATISDRFAGLLASGADGAADRPSLLGLEQEFSLRDGHGRVVDFGQVLARRPDVGRRLDPADRFAARRPTGIVVTADGAEAEAAIPPVPLRPGFTVTLDGWATLARDEITAVAPEHSRVDGYSTHLSVSVPEGADADRISKLFATTFAPALLVATDSPGAPGLFTRPRPGRVEIGIPFVEGPSLRSAALLAAGGVAACEAVVGGRAGAGSLPPELRARLVPSVHRYGWYLGRDALDGRGRRARTSQGPWILVRDHFRRATEVAAAALGADAGPVDLASAGTSPHPNGLVVAPPSAPRELVALLGPRHRPGGLSIDAVVATWGFAVLRFGTPGTRSAYACVPRRHLADFFDRLDAGDLDPPLLAFLHAPAGERRLEHYAQTDSPALFDEVRIGANLSPPEIDAARRLVSGEDARRAKYDDDRDDAATAGMSLGPGCRPRWLHGVGAVFALGALAWGWSLLGGGGGTTSSPTTTAAAAPTRGCGSGLTGPDFSWSALTRPCSFPPAYRIDTEALERAGVKVEIPEVPGPFTAKACVDHSVRSSDARTGRPGLSTIIVGVGGLPRGAVAEIGIEGPGGPWTGRGTAGADGRATVDVPIDVPATFRLTTAGYYPDGDVTKAMSPFSPSGLPAEVDASDLSLRCDVGALLDGLPSGSGSNGTAYKRRAEARAVGEGVVKETAGLFPMLEVLRHPGRDLSIGGRYEVTVSDRRLDLMTPGGPLDFSWSAGGGVRGAWSTAGATPEAVARWFDALRCGPGPLAIGACGDGAAPVGGAGRARRSPRPAEVEIPEGEWLVVGVAPKATIPITDPDADWSVTVTIGDRRYAARPDAGGEVRLDVDGVGGTSARLFVRDDVAMLVAPVADLGPIGSGTVVEARAEVQVGGKVERFPADAKASAAFGEAIAVTAPPRTGGTGVSTTTASTVPTTAAPRPAGPAEAVADFVPRLYRSLLTHDDFAFDHLDPAVIDRYGAEQCRAFVAGREHAADLGAAVRGVGDPEDYAYASDGLSETLTGVYPVDATLTEHGEAEDHTMHIGVRDHDGESFPTWFTDCGEPAG